ncbi:hypothetical protein PRUPE_5G163900 [Prunus persica]|uniref:Uncharacterized protein n=1 Tax=Prunus persica TaxID=3760 RepID=A0A251P9C8_PRUPE|nr:hypothetical protein PRUPE_5G163900 [Prunus persica]
MQSRPTSTSLDLVRFFMNLGLKSKEEEDFAIFGCWEFLRLFYYSMNPLATDILKWSFGEEEGSGWVG